MQGFLQQKPQQRYLLIMTGLAMIASIVIWFLFVPHEQVMQERGTGIVPYELAFTASRANEILEGWGTTGVEAARRSLWIDYGFMPAYGLFFAGTTLILARTQKKGMQRLGVWLILGVTLSVVCDALENAMLLTMLGTAGQVPAILPMIAGVAATIKFLFLVISLVYWVLVGLVKAQLLLRK